MIKIRVKYACYQLNLALMTQNCILYANPWKLASDPMFAAHGGITLSTFDSALEIHKVPLDEGDAGFPFIRGYCHCSRWRRDVPCGRASWPQSGTPHHRHLMLWAGLAGLRVLDEQFEQATSVIMSAIRDYVAEISDLMVIAELGIFSRSSSSPSPPTDGFM